MDLSKLMSKELLEIELCGGKISMALLEAEARARETVRRRQELMMLKKALERELADGTISMAQAEAETRDLEEEWRREDEKRRSEEIPLTEAETEERKKQIFDLCVSYGFPPAPWMTKDQVDAIAAAALARLKL